MRIRLFAVGWLLAILLNGCSSNSYYSQAIYGQYKILSDRRPIAEVLADPATSEALKKRLKFVLALREFAKDELHLPVAGHYLSYVDLGRRYAVWNVFAAPEFSLTLKTWCYPVVGCAVYRGYFSKQDALNYAETLKAQNYDVYVGGVTAYSTLGWFDDPVFSNILYLSEADSAALIFHELAHQILYVKDDTTFNESFATAVEQEGLRRWQMKSDNSNIYNDYLRDHRNQDAFIRLVMKYRRRLEKLYQTDLSVDRKRAEKARIFTQLKAEYEDLKKNLVELSGYDAWFLYSLNNAKILSVAAYHDQVPAFLRLLERNNGELERFYRECRNLAKQKKADRDQILHELMSTPSSFHSGTRFALQIHTQKNHEASLCRTGF